MNPTMARLLRVALQAPSGDNTQPVRFRVDESAGTIALTIDPTRDPSPMNAGQRMARMAAGASLENLVQAARSMGLGAVVDLEPPGNGSLAVVRLAGQPSQPMPSTPAPRLTNRRAYDARAIDLEVLDRLGHATPDLDGVTTRWVVDRGRIDALADLVARADALMFGDPSMRRAFLSKVRFDEPPGAEVAEGLSLGSIEASFAERLALRVVHRTPDRLLRLGRIAEVFRTKARHLVRSASGLCLVVAPDGDDSTDLVVGRALQRAWLALSSEGLAVQPMMSLMVLENVQEQGEPALRGRLGLENLRRLRDDFRVLAPEIGDQRPAWLMRFGQAPSPSGRTGRLPVEAVVLGPSPGQ